MVERDLDDYDKGAQDSIEVIPLEEAEKYNPPIRFGSVWFLTWTAIFISIFREFNLMRSILWINIITVFVMPAVAFIGTLIYIKWMEKVEHSIHRKRKE